MIEEGLDTLLYTKLQYVLSGLWAIYTRQDLSLHGKVWIEGSHGNQHELKHWIILSRTGDSNVVFWGEGVG